MKIHILDSENYSQKALKIYRQLGEVSLHKEGMSVSIDLDILITRLYPIREVEIEAFPNLKIIGSSTTGLDHIDVDYAESRGIKVISFHNNTEPIKNISSTAEHTWGLILALVRNYPKAFNSASREEVGIGHELQGKTIGLIGCGRIGKMVVKYAQAFGMKILIYDPPAEKYLKKHGFEEELHFDTDEKSLEELFIHSDIVSVHCPLNLSTKAMIKKRHFDMMSSSSYFINTARPQIVEDGALLWALNNRLAGAAVDFCDFSHPKLITTPHVGGFTVEGMDKAETALARLVEAEIKKGG